jgi:plasmid stabilization system protein ParE
VTRIRYTEDAVRDLEEIYRYIAEDNINAAMEHRQRLRRRCLGIVDHARMERKHSQMTVTSFKILSIFFSMTSHGPPAFFTYASCTI